MASRDSAELVWPRSARSLLGRKVRVGDVNVGSVADVVVNRSVGHVLGLVVEGRSGQPHFLPWVAARVEEDQIVPTSVFGLLSATELSFYLENGVRLSHAIDGPGAAGGPLDDLLIDPDGDVAAIVRRRPATTPFAAEAAG
ncbi:PRC-barrel domain-containing protein [Gaiella sp.]|jgi:PRC-barrel domain protein|uniref:PRC-barrel domain-containing protein n=1 Tax=Gaiella sp. TaxID=2663207 RepID=UPI002CE99F41|nr:PRC-barrel domain-containing protein [Gaiella sp.]HWO82058.1 PRC-barrel domain-containing protein [Gaiella sp.]